MKTSTFIAFIGLSLLFLSIKIFGGEFVVKQGNTTMFQITKNSYEEFQFTSTIASIKHFTVQTEKGNFEKLVIPKYIGKGKIGCPELPHLFKLIEIPQDAQIQVNVLNYDVDEYNLSDFGITEKIFPYQPSLSKSVDPTTVEFYYHAEAYTQNSYDNAPLVSYQILGQMRGVRIARIALAPIKYNPKKNKIKVYTNIEVKITYTNANIAKTEKTKKITYSPYFESAYKKISNYKAKDTLTKYPVKYVIVSDPMFQSALQPFIQWKTKKGFYVVEAYTNNPNVGTTTTSIKAYLENLYNSATPSDPAPSFVLLVGDVAQIPAFNGTTDNHVTDLYFCEYTGDFFPEVYYGRFSATNLTQLQPQIDKTLQYEQYLMPDPSFLDEVVMIAGVDATYAPTWGNGQINYGTINYFNAAHGITSHTYLYPASVTSDAQIIQDVSNGVGFANYTAHGSPDGWSDPAFEIIDIAGLQNKDMYPLMIGNACSTSPFDGDCFGEELLRAENKGALGYIGGSNSTYWNEDYWWAVGNGPIDSFPTYAQTSLGAYDRTFHDHGEPPSEWYPTQAGMIFAGNLAVTESSSSYDHYYWEVYHLMGDPSLMIYYSVPEILSVNYDLDSIPIGVGTLTVTTEPYTYVALSMNNVLYAAVLSNTNGMAQLNFTPFYTPGTATIVATKQNRQPYISDITVFSPSGAYVVLSSYLAKDEAGNNNGTADYSETITVDASLKNVGNAIANNVTATLSTTDSYVTITDNTESFGNINPGEVVTKIDAYSFNIADFVPDQHIVAFNLQIEDALDSIWNSDFNVTLNAPILDIYDVSIDDAGGNNNGVLDAGETANLIITTSNIGHSASPSATGTLTSTSPYITINTITANLGVISTQTSVNGTFSITIDDSATMGAVVDFTYTVQANNYTAQETFYLTIGICSEDFETGDFTKFAWTSGGNLPWIINSINPYEGIYCAKSGTISNNQTSELMISFNVLSADTIYFYKKVSSEGCYESYGFYCDYLEFLIDGNSKGQWDGEHDWSLEKFPVTQGQHTFKWVYVKDAVFTEGQDAAWIDYILFPPASMVSVSNNPIALTDVTLFNFPNPFNTTTSINYRLNETSVVTLKVYDMVGNIVSILVNNQKQTSGFHYITFDAMTLDAGMYFCQLQTEKQVITHKLLVIKE